MMDQKKVRVAVTAPRGAMDSLILQEAYKNEEIEVVGAVGTPGRDYIGKDAGLVCGLGQEIGAPVVDDIGKIIDDCDIVIDFSRVELSMQILDACLRHGKGLICGTTGFSEEQTEVLLAAGDKIPMMKAANTSFVVNVMRKILGIAAEKLGSKAKIEIIEMHSATKRDAPSGTAIELAMEDLLIDSSKKDGYVTEEDIHTTVVLDTNLSEGLISEGFMREIVSKVQTMRKEAGFEVTDHIEISYEGSRVLYDVIDRYGDSIRHDCLADKLVQTEPYGYTKSWEINGEIMEIGVAKI